MTEGKPDGESGFSPSGRTGSARKGRTDEQPNGSFGDGPEIPDETEISVDDRGREG